MKMYSKYFWFFLGLILFVAFKANAQTRPDTESATDVLRKYQFEVWQKLDSIKTLAQHGVTDLQRNLRNMEVEVADGGKMVLQGDTIDVATPMKDIIGGVGQIGKAFGLPDDCLDPLRESANEMPYYLKAGLDFLKDIDLGTGNASSGNKNSNK